MNKNWPTRFWLLISFLWVVSSILRADQGDWPMSALFICVAALCLLIYCLCKRQDERTP